MGMCFGVRDAIELAHERAAAGPVTVLGDLVHNESVLADLRGKGVLIRQDASDIPTREVLITAHGASNRRIESLRQLGLTVTEATCPLVHRAHQALKKLVAAGFHPLVIGQAGHVEVRGLTDEVASISRTESKRYPVPWNPSSKTPLPKRGGSSINRSNARSFATGYRAVSLRRSLPKNLVSTKACSSLGGSSCPPPKLGGRRRWGAGGLRLRIFNLNWMLLVARSATCMSSGTF